MKQLLILSGKGGTGKTTIASAFIQLLQAKVYADCDVDAPNLHLVTNTFAEGHCTDFYGMSKAEIDLALCTQCNLCRESCRFGAITSSPEYAVDVYACEGCGVCREICPRGAVSLKPLVAGELMLFSSNVVFSTAQLKPGSGNSGMLVTEVKKQLQLADNFADVTIIDGAPGIGCPVIASLSGVDLVLLVAEPSLSGLSDMQRIIKTAEQFQTQIAVCINKWDTNPEIADEIEQYCQRHKLSFVGKVPFDPDAQKAINCGKSVVDIDCTSGQAVKDVLQRTMEIIHKMEGI